ncbi:MULTISPECIES: divalent-cation tolerance protein CutA [unclassified Sphingomonas]|uniref:divalent-cation tolerance protein CutA n=1 Tax=unclassified Sphingomonas TaxID=196159 RepID=UPI00160B77D9|nr:MULTISPECIES: divalent-cation tolerance protein CutA [unclassified Sphingomonas]MBB3346831.1 periplasmic divalent cation tolerance protein [Sphingomonas sp. BK069]MBB3475615.1 periplasmic divalent cation tolerance protein [Sphingomonas sp. BK345]
MSGAITISCACAGRDQARTIANVLVDRRLAACVQLCGVESVYRWEGETQRDDEVLLTAKTLSRRFDAVAACIRELHSYAVPEILAQPIVAAGLDYLAWLEEEVG